MDWFNETLHALLAGANIDIATEISGGNLKVAFTSGVTPDITDGGDEFMDDLTATGTIETEATLASATWTNRVLDHPDGVTIPDPDSATAATWAVVYIDTGTPSTSRLLGADDITDLSFDGEDDTLNFHADGILQLGS